MCPASALAPLIDYHAMAAMADYEKISLYPNSHAGRRPGAKQIATKLRRPATATSACSAVPASTPAFGRGALLQTGLEANNPCGGMVSLTHNYPLGMNREVLYLADDRSWNRLIA